MLTMWVAHHESDEEFVQRLFLENKLAMFIAARNIVKDYHTARDMVSESCITIITKIEYLRKVDVEKQTAYIISIVQNNAKMYVRKQQRERQILTENWYMFNDGVAEVQQGVDSKLITEAETQVLMEALSKIHKRDSDLLKMKYFEKLSDERIGEVMEISAASVRFYLTKARRNLEEELKRREAE